MAESKEKIEDLIRERFSADRDLDERRMDTLARLLSGRNTCVSITLVRGQFYITANEFFAGTQPERNEGYKSIQAVMEYFCTLAKEDVDKAAEQAIFRKACEERLKGLGQEKPVIPSGMVNAIVDSVLNGEDPTTLELMQKYGENAQIAGFLQGEFRKLYRDFLKLKTSVIAKRDNVDRRENEITSEQFEALRSGNLYISLDEPRQHEKEGVGKGKAREGQEKKPTQKPVHAEAQLLSGIVGMLDSGALKKDVPQRLYVGISKLCCLNCRVMLEAANEVFKENNIQITLETRGKHDLDFSWVPPKRFEDGYHLDSLEEDSTLEQRIGYLTKERVERLKERATPTGIGMSASQSSSDDEGVIEANIQERKASLETTLALMKGLQQNFLQQMTTEGMRELLAIAIALHQLKRFSDVYQMIDPRRKQKPEKVQRDFANLFQDLQALEPSFSQVKILQVLQSADLVGTTMAGHFEGFSLVSPAFRERDDTIMHVDPPVRGIGVAESPTTASALMLRAASVSASAAELRRVGEEPRGTAVRAEGGPLAPLRVPSPPIVITPPVVAEVPPPVAVEPNAGAAAAPQQTPPDPNAANKRRRLGE